MANYLVTGGCGFIGSHLVESLQKDGHSVRILDNLSTGKQENIPTGNDLVIGDITDRKRVHHCMRDIDGCFHLAAVSSVQESNASWTETHRVNQTGTINILDAARKHKTPVVYASSAAVYGDSADTPLKECSATRPLTAYGADKLGSEIHARVASLVHGVPTAGMRLFNVYGPRQNPMSPYSGVISIFMDRFARQQPLTVFGDGEQVRDFIYVTDAVRFMRTAMNGIRRTASIFNACTGEAVSINQLIKIIMSVTGLQVPVSHQPIRNGDIRISVGDPGYARQLLGISAETGFVQGLRALIDYNTIEVTAHHTASARWQPGGYSTIVPG